MNWGCTHLSLLSAVILGLLQGLLEFLPVSSTGHLMLLQNVFQIEEVDLFFDVMVHVGSLLAILISFRSEVKKLLYGVLGLIGTGPFASSETLFARSYKRMAVFVIVGCLPLIPSVLFMQQVSQIGDSLLLLGFLFLINGTIINIACKRRTRQIPEGKISVLDSFIVGVAQLFSIIPGISRCGMTISTGMMRGFDKLYSIKYSIFLSIPAILFAAIATGIKAVYTGVEINHLPMYLIAMVSATTMGIISIRFVRWIIAKDFFSTFAYYCWGVGVITLVLSLVS